MSKPKLSEFIADMNVLFNQFPNAEVDFILRREPGPVKKAKTSWLEICTYEIISPHPTGANPPIVRVKFYMR